MERDKDNYGGKKWLEDANAALISAVCHMIAVLALALFTVASEHDTAINLWISPADSEGDASEDALNELQIGLPEQDLPSASELSEALELASLQAEDATLDASLADYLRPRDLGSGFELAGAGGNSARGSGLGTGTAKFFGIRGRGKSFVYVIDCSTSMTEMNKFEHAKAELLRSLRSLRPDQRYCVVLFSDGAYPMDADEPILATDANLEQTAEWLDSLQPNGKTNPLPALMYALSMKPNGIYFLSDGRFDLSVIDELRAKNQPKRKRIPIHTISFYTRQTEGLMKMIARNSGGQYRFVSPQLQL